MEFGITVGNFGTFGKRGGAAEIIEVARFAEQAGFDSVWVMDHFYQLPSMGGPMVYPPDYGYGLAGVYAIWLAVVILMYPLCSLFAGVKRRRRDWWLSYL